MKKFLIFFLMLLPLAIASCGGDDKDEPQNTNEGNNGTTDVSATTSVKTAIISQMMSITFYEDYNYQYKFFLVNGNIHVLHSIRLNGEWISKESAIHGLNHFGIKDVGKVNGLSEITSKDIIMGEGITDNGICFLAATFQPNHGYVIKFTTEGGETKYLRIFTTNYTTGSNGALATVTVQYQLF